MPEVIGTLWVGALVIVAGAGILWAVAGLLRWVLAPLVGLVPTTTTTTTEEEER
jgi:predicted cobalt transporter CbtA